MCQVHNRHGKVCGKLPKTSGMQPFATPTAYDLAVASLTRSRGRMDASRTKARSRREFVVAPRCADTVRSYCHEASVVMRSSATDGSNVIECQEKWSD